MECPFCGRLMQAGRIDTAKPVNIEWYPEDKESYLEKADVYKRQALSIPSYGKVRARLKDNPQIGQNNEDYLLC